MGNRSNRDQWSARERQMFIERLGWWRGMVNRGDLHDVFGISAAQASADIQSYIALNPNALIYNLRSKRYEAQPGMTCKLHKPRLDDAVRLFLGGDSPALVSLSPAQPGDGVDVFRPLTRQASANVERRLFLALDQRRRFKVKYWSVSRGTARKREIAPHALGHDGYRWHARAWCFENQDYRDFVLSRMETADWPGAEFVPPEPDQAWDTIERIVLRPHASLNKTQKKAIEYDYGMTRSRLEVPVRGAMKEYLLAHLRIPVLDENGNSRPSHLELVKSGR
jgi:hypothetical protein